MFAIDISRSRLEQRNAAQPGERPASQPAGGRVTTCGERAVKIAIPILWHDCRIRRPRRRLLCWNGGGDRRGESGMRHRRPTRTDRQRERENRMALELNVLKCYMFGMFPLSRPLYTPRTESDIEDDSYRHSARVKKGRRPVRPPPSSSGFEKLL